MPTLLFEIGTEELPSWYVPEAKEAIVNLLTEKLASSGLAHGAVRGYATPRRIAVLAENVAEKSEVRTEVKRGPPRRAAFGASGKPTKAALGFAAATGVRVEELFTEETDKGGYVFARQRSGGEAAKAILPGVLADIVKGFPAPRKMRWADIETPFLRPVSWLTALLDGEVLSFQAAGRCSSRNTHGHRFLHPQEVSLAHAEEYVGALEHAFVIADPETRQARIQAEAERVAGEAGLTLAGDDVLLNEVSGMVEWPVAILGRFDESYLDLPEEVLATTMIHHQRFFPTRKGGKPAPYFLAIANNRVPDEALVRRGYEQVLEGRLADARFFWDADRRKSLTQHAQALSGITFHKGLGSVADKVKRVGISAEKLAEAIGLDKNAREALAQAAPLFRADLATQMVFELPELEGIMAGAYALAEGYPAEVAEALEHGIRPSTPGGPLPTSPAGAVLAVSDRLDKLLGFFALGKRPTGSADPFGLRRDAIATARILNAQGWTLPVSRLVKVAASGYGSSPLDTEAARAEVSDFLWERMVGLLADEGLRTEVIRAAVADDPPVITAARRAHLLSVLSLEPEFAPLLTLYKRAANLAGQARTTAEVDPVPFQDAHEAPLYAALGPAKDSVERLLDNVTQTLPPWDLGRGPTGKLGGLGREVTGILALKAPLDAFLDHVLVMVDDERVRENRLALLREVKATLRALGALEELEGMAAAA
jgi:glycyl-tRNA synthetase beta chain